MEAADKDAASTQGTKLPQADGIRSESAAHTDDHCPGRASTTIERQGVTGHT
jgi:hypothetical protein